MSQGDADERILTEPNRAKRPARVVLAARRSLDLSALAQLIRDAEALKLVAWCADLDAAAVHCADLTPDVALLDATFPDGAAFELAEALLRRRHVQAVAFLDDEFAMARAQRAVAIPQAAYFTRHDEFTHLCGGVCELLARTSGAASAAECGCSPPKFLLDAGQLRARNDDGFLGLSRREREVMQLLARGHTVPDTARMLHISRSTVDNHKARIFEKLKIRHMTQITRVALRVGLID